SAWEPVLQYTENHTSIAVDFVFVEGGTEDVDILEHNRDLCLRKGVKRRWVTPSGRDTRSKARNKGAEYADGEYLLFVDGDCWPDFKDVLHSFALYASHNLVISGYINSSLSSGELLGEHREPWAGAMQNLILLDDLWMMHEQAFMVHRDLFFGVGGFDASWAYHGFCFEGIDLYTRMFAKYFTPLAICPYAAFTHQPHEKDVVGNKSHQNLELFKTRLREETFKDLLWHPAVQKKLSVLEGFGRSYDIR